MIAVVDYGLGNLTSIGNMFKRIGVEAVITADHDILRNASKLLLPGVGHFRQGMDNLHRSGLKALLDTLVLEQGKPVLGICLGAQLMTMHSEEGDCDGLQWVNCRTRKFDANRLGGLKVPHMGWSDITIVGDSPLWQQLPAEPRFYHVHSYHFETTEPGLVIATAHYGYDFPTAFQRGNIFGTQFHPEKSHKFGMAVLTNFSKI